MSVMQRYNTILQEPLITVKDEGTVSYYHISECCRVEEIKRKAEDVFAAIKRSGFPMEDRDILQEKLKSLLHMEGKEYGDDDDDDNDDDTRSFQG